MLLQRLKEFADTRMELPPKLYSPTSVRYIIELDREGRFLGIVDTAEQKGKAKRGQTFLMPQVNRTYGISPLLLTDKADYVLGIGKEGAKPDRVIAAHKAFRELLDRCASSTQVPELHAIQLFLDAHRTDVQLPPEFDPTTFMTFRVDGILLTTLAAIQVFWADEHTAGEADATIMQCVVCGQQRPVLRTLQGVIKGIPGGQSSGTTIISANARAFESYGLENSLIAPTCADCGERFTKALNHLLASDQHCIKIAGMAFVFWTREESGFNFATALSSPEPEQIKALYQSLYKGTEQSEVDASAFYAATLSASSARAVVRDWLDTTVGAAKQALARWFYLQQIVGERGGIAPPLSVSCLADATVRERKDLPVTTMRALVRTALVGTPLPLSLLYQAVRRSRAEQGVTRQRAALIKLVLLSNASETEERTMVELDPNHPSSGYRCGRLLAVLADIQYNAIGNTAIVDGFYGAASSAPVAVFGRLVRGAQPHLSKLERDRPATGRALQQRLEEILAGLQSFPTTLSLEGQGMFALGFYHQRAADRAQMQERMAKKRADATATAAATADETDLFAGDTTDDVRF